MYIGLSVKYQLFLSVFNETWTGLLDFRKILKYKISRESIQWEKELFQADRRTDRQKDMMKLIGAFCNFANTTKILL